MTLPFPRFVKVFSVNNTYQQILSKKVYKVSVRPSKNEVSGELFYPRERVMEVAYNLKNRIFKVITHEVGENIIVTICQ